MISNEERNNRINELLPLIKDGDSQAIASIIALLEKDLQKLAMKYLLNVQDAESVVYATFYKFFSRINKLKNEKNLWAWLRTVVVNDCLDMVKKYKKEVTFEGLIEKYYVSSQTTISDATEQIFIRECLKELNNDERTVLILHSQDYTLAEISKISNLSMKKVRSRLDSAKNKFKIFFEEGKN